MNAVRRPSFLAPLRLAVLLLALTGAARAESFDATNAAYDELFHRATRYGNTPERRSDKAAAQQELVRRGGAALREGLARAHYENVMLQAFTEDLARNRLPPDQALPVVAEFLGSEHAQTRRFALYLAAFFPGQAHAPRALELLADDACRNAAIRALGKWKVREARPELRAYLASDLERTRIAAVNALAEIGDRDDLPALLPRLGDPVFTVREAARRAVTAQGWHAQRPLLDRLDRARGAERRQIVRALGELKARGAVRPLRALLEARDPALRADVAWALRQIEPNQASRWLQGVEVYRLDRD